MINFASFVLLSFLLVILPGPDTVMVTKNTLGAGISAGSKTLLGICLALCIHTFIAVVGLSALIVHSSHLFALFKIIGATYLLYLGVTSLLATRRKTQVEQEPNNSTSNKQASFRQGFLTDLLNPKVAVFFLTFLPQFVNPNESTLMPFILLGATYIILTLLFMLGYILLLDKIHIFMKKASTQKAIQAISGVVLIIFSVKLAFEKAN